MTTPTTETQESTALVKITKYMDAPLVRQRFSDVLGEHGAGVYISSVLIAVANSTRLQECTPASIYTSALRAATLRLSVDPSLGQAYMVPYGRNAQLIVGYKGLYDMAIRTGKYRYVNVGKVYEGQEVIEDQITGFHTIRGYKTSDKIIGWIGAFSMYQQHQDYSKTFYMPVEEIHEHAEKYSQSYHQKDGPWQKETPKMERKTVLRLMLRRWGYMDPADVQVLDEIEATDDQPIDAQFTDLAKSLDAQGDDETEPGTRRTREQNLNELGFDTQPAPAEWPAEKVQVLVKAKLATNEFAARGMLGLSNLRPSDPDDLIRLWGSMYRDKRGAKPTKDSPTSAEAAAHANAAIPHTA